MEKYKLVCLDAGHGSGCVNGSPDGLYKEDEFAMDMARRIGEELGKCGLDVVYTRDEDGYPSLTERCTVSNTANADLFVSIHSNASGSSGWSSARGLCIYTYAHDESAERNIAAGILLDSFGYEEDMVFFGSKLYYESEFTVLAKTNAPAMLIEYGFHTNVQDVALLSSDAYRQRLALATACGIYEYFSDREKREEVADKVASFDEGNIPSTWAEAAWELGTMLGVIDGTRPQDSLTREEFVVVLERLGLLKMEED